ncbi:MAG: SARP family transcriptional regulator [Actinomycetota bacterium]|nr:SARP family transcriptional regulator [Actinomycetota bacterium]
MSVEVRGRASIGGRAFPADPPDEPRIRLRLLQGFELSCDHDAVDVPTSAQRVVAFLALHDRSLLRTFVAGTLWPDVSERRSLASLRSALWRLHRLGLALLNATADHVELDQRVDVDHREATSVARAILGSSNDVEPGELELLRLDGTLLPDWYDDWVFIERERLLQLRLHALERLSGRLVSAGRFAEAVEAALAAVNAEPLRESAHRALISVYLAEGNAASAIRQYELYRRLLAHELQVAPSGLMEDLMASSSCQGQLQAGARLSALR